MKRSLLVVALTLLTACEKGPYALSSHTVQVGPNEEADVVWIQLRGEVYRCTGRDEKPVCVPAAGE
jgi:hypothetical protein